MNNFNQVSKNGNHLIDCMQQSKPVYIDNREDLLNYIREYNSFGDKRSIVEEYKHKGYLKIEGGLV